MSKFYNFKYLFFLILPFIATAVWYSPVLFKGYPISPIHEQIVLGKNIAKTGMYALESDLNILLSSDLLKEKAHLSSIGNKLTGYFYAFIFRNFGFLSWRQLVLFSIILNAVVLLIFAFLVFYLFDFRTSVVFSLIYIFLPFVWMSAQDVGTYEIALFFIALFFLLYFLGQRFKCGFILLIFSGFFLVLSAMAREAFLLFIPIIFIYLLLKKEKAAIFLIFIPVFLVLSIFYLPDFLNNRNSYLQFFPVTKVSEKLRASDFIFVYGEFYPDPYTYHFDKDSFLKGYADRRDSQGLILSTYLQKGAVNAGADHITFGRRVLLNFLLLFGHVSGLISLEIIGGPFIFFLILLGLYYLKKEQTSLFWLFIYLILGVFFLISFVLLLARNHFLDFGWILALLAALGLLSLVSMMETHFKLDKKKAFLVFIFVLAAVLYNFLLTSHTYWGRVYDNKENLLMLDYASKIEKLNISGKEVIALGIGGAAGSVTLNYLEDKSIIVFQSRTIKKLLESGKISSVFKDFGVKYIVGYPKNLSQKILRATGVVNIGSSNVSEDESVNEPVFINWDAKSWLMNFIR